MTYRQKETFRMMRFDQATREKAWRAVPREEQALLVCAIRAALDGHRATTLDALDRYAVTRYRGSRRAREDAARDARRRVLVGARLDRGTADRVKVAAAARGVSVYRFVRDAIEKELFHIETICGIMGSVDGRGGGETRTNVPSNGD